MNDDEPGPCGCYDYEPATIGGMACCLSCGATDDGPVEIADRPSGRQLDAALDEIRRIDVFEMAFGLGRSPDASPTAAYERARELGR